MSFYNGKVDVYLFVGILWVCIVIIEKAFKISWEFVLAARTVIQVIS
jgi:hypothetical protein